MRLINYILTCCIRLWLRISTTSRMHEFFLFCFVFVLKNLVVIVKAVLIKLFTTPVFKMFTIASTVDSKCLLGTILLLIFVSGIYCRYAMYVVMLSSVLVAKFWLVLLCL